MYNQHITIYNDYPKFLTPPIAPPIYRPFYIVYTAIEYAPMDFISWTFYTGRRISAHCAHSVRHSTLSLRSLADLPFHHLKKHHLCFVPIGLRLPPLKALPGGACPKRFVPDTVRYGGGIAPVYGRSKIDRSYEGVFLANSGLSLKA
jgi:hypothetical protein